MHPHALFNDEIRPVNEAILSAAHLGPFTGWGVFTTLRFVAGVPFAFERHFARMHKDAQVLRMPFPYHQDQLRRQLIQLAEKNDLTEGAMRVYVGRSSGNAWAMPSTGADGVYLVATSKDHTTWAETVSLMVHRDARHAASPFRGTKTLTWSHNLTMLDEAKAAGFDETILLNERGQVAECTAANIFVVRDGITWTPPLTDGPLPGVTRAILLEEISSPELPVQEGSLYPDDIFEAGEVFITSTTRDLIPVACVGIRDLTATTWPVTESLRAKFRRYLAEYAAAAQAASAPVTG